MPLPEQITNVAVFEDVYRFLLNGSGGWSCAVLMWQQSVSSFRIIDIAIVMQ
ncbi:hypothetical protein EBCG_03856 [Escherichia marmotae]|nr:hypothetical protein EBCG_03856 [Escherichia marmotae]